MADLVAGLEAHPGARRFELTELPRGAVAAIVRTEIPEADDELCTAFAEASAGNPLYVRELLRSVRSRSGAAPTTAAVREVAVASVAERVMRRVAALGPPALRLAAAMSALGSSGRLRDAAAVAALEEVDAGQAARAMRRVEILAADDPFEWIHPIVRRSIYDGLSVTERDDRHSRAADVLAETRRPYRASSRRTSRRCDRRARSASWRVCLPQPRRPWPGMLPRIAVTLLRRALDEQANKPPAPRLLLRLGQLEVSAGIRRRRERSKRRSSSRPTLPNGHWLRLHHRGDYVLDGSWDAAAESRNRRSIARRARRGAGPRVGAHHAALVRLSTPTLVSQFRQSRERLRALARKESWSAPRAVGRILATMTAFFGGTTSTKCRGSAPTPCRRRADRRARRGLVRLGLRAWCPRHARGVRAGARIHGELERAEARRASVANVITSGTYRGWIALLRGDLAGAEEILRPLVDISAQSGMVLVLVTLLWGLPDVIAERPSRTRSRD